MDPKIIQAEFVEGVKAKVTGIQSPAGQVKGAVREIAAGSKYEITLTPVARIKDEEDVIITTDSGLPRLETLSWCACLWLSRVAWSKSSGGLLPEFYVHHEPSSFVNNLTLP